MYNNVVKKHLSASQPEFIRLLGAGCWVLGAPKPWNNGNRDPGWGVAEIQKMSPPTTVGDVADMQLCVIKQGSPPVLGNVAFFVTDLLTLARCAVCILVR